MQKDGLRRVHEPRDERPAVRASDRVYRNLPLGLTLSVFALLVLLPFVRDAFAPSTSTGLRVFALAFAVALLAYVVRAIRADVRLGPHGVLVRNVFSTRRALWVHIVAIRSVPAYAEQLSLFGGIARTVAFELTDGRELRPLALRRREREAGLIADDLTELARQLGAPLSDVEDNGDRAVVDELHLHARAEDPGRDRHPQRP
jgi:hypothetical protein